VTAAAAASAAVVAAAAAADAAPATATVACPFGCSGRTTVSQGELHGEWNSVSEAGRAGGGGGGGGSL